MQFMSYVTRSNADLLVVANRLAVQLDKARYEFCNAFQSSGVVAAIVVAHNFNTRAYENMICEAIIVHHILKARDVVSPLEAFIATLPATVTMVYNEEEFNY